MCSYDAGAFTDMYAEADFSRHSYAWESEDSSAFQDSTGLGQSQSVSNPQSEMSMMAYYPVQYASESFSETGFFGGLSAQTNNSYQPTAEYFQQREANVCTFNNGALWSVSHDIPGFDQCQSESGVARLNLDDFSDWSESDDEQEKALPGNAEKELQLPVRDEQEKAVPANIDKELKLPGSEQQGPVHGSLQEPDEEPASEPSPCARNALVAAKYIAVELQTEISTPKLSLSVGEPDGEVLESKCHRQMQKAAVPTLAVSENSWTAQRRRARQLQADVIAELPSDEQVARSVKSILNKLTLEKFEPLFAQLVACGLRSAVHAELLIHEIFEKATTQHHFIDMYADLCVRLHEHFTQHPLAPAANKALEAISFKRLLLDECQASFERRSAASGQDREDKEEARRYKTAMVGNIKLVGALLSRGVLAGKVALAILEELLGDPTSEALECVALLLTCAGAALDRPDWNYHAALKHMFGRISQMMKESQVFRARERFLLKDLLELRAAGYVNKRPMQLEHATTLAQVAKQASQFT